MNLTKDQMIRLLEIRNRIDTRYYDIHCNPQRTFVPDMDYLFSLIIKLSTPDVKELQGEELVNWLKSRKSIIDSIEFDGMSLDFEAEGEQK